MRRKTRIEKYFERYKWLEQEINVFPNSATAKTARIDMQDIKEEILLVSDEILRSMLWLRFIEGLGYSDIAYKLYCSHGTVCRKLYGFFDKEDEQHDHKNVYQGNKETLETIDE